MSPVELLSVSLSAIALGQSLLAVSLLSTRNDPRRIYAPLIVFFLANVVTEASTAFEPLLKHLNQINWIHTADIMSLLSSLLMAPALWFYVQSITSQDRVKLSSRQLFHLTPFFIGAAICCALMLIPFDIRDQLIGDTEGPDTQTILIFTVLLVFLILLWIVQCTVYVIAIIRRLIRYRVQLKNFYASTEKHELNWVLWVAIMLSGVLTLSAVDSLSNLPDSMSILLNVIDVLLVWVIAQWGLRQLPALASNNSRSDDDEVNTNSHKKKYQRSALTQTQLEEIARKIELAMQDDQLYLEPNLALADLSKHISVIPNYVSQALNGLMQKSFFDYINHWRIERAKQLLTETKETVLDINHIVGFNSRSSFYKSFKLNTELTPTEYRKRNGSTQALASKNR